MNHDQQGARELALGRYLNGPGSAFGAFEQGFDAGYSAGAEAERAKIADMADEEAPTHEDAYYGGIATVALQNFAKRIRNLPVGESSRAPEGSTK